MRFRPVRRLTTRGRVALATVAATGSALALAAVAVPGPAQGAPTLRVSSPPAASARATSTVLLDRGDRVGRKALLAADASRLVEYGAFSLWTVPNRGRASVADVPSLAATLTRPQVVLRGRTLETSRPVPAPATLPATDTAGTQLEIVQFVGPIKPGWLSELEDTGARVVSYVPDNAYVVSVAPAAAKAYDALVGSDPLVQYAGAFHPEYRLAPQLLDAVVKPASAPPTSDVTVQVVDGPGADEAVAAVTAGREVLAPPYAMLGVRTLSVRVDTDDLAELASMPTVYDVEPYLVPELNDEAQDQLLAGNVTTVGGKTVPSGPGYLSWLAGQGFPTDPSQYPVVTVVDDGIDNGTTDPLHPDFHLLGDGSAGDRLIANGDCTTDPNGNGVGGHGNLNAGIVGGYNDSTGATNEDADGYQYGLGVSPYGRVSGLKIFRNSGSYDVSACGNSDAGVVAAAFAAGADITTNSWGSDVFGAYDASSQAYDALTRDASTGTAGLQEMLHIFSAGNAGPNATTIGSPGTAKNVLTVGATENVREDGTLDGCNLSAADNDSDIANFSSRGPAADGRNKPEIVAAGTHVQGPASQDPGYNGTGVCGSLGNKYHPLGNTLYTWSSGTSHSTPAVAGAVSLVHEFYGRVWEPGAVPSPAMLRALLTNAPRYLQGGVGTGDTLPSPNQGLGVPDLGVLFDAPASRLLVDQSTLFTGTGQTARRVGTVADGSKGVRVTLAWTDAPGATVGGAWVNDLDLRVTAGGKTYRGNVFSGGTSATGGTADGMNNLESVWLPAGTTGPVSIQVMAKNIAGNGVPGNATATDQDFALTASNLTEGSSSVVAGDGLLVTDTVSDGNTTPDPGEPLEVSATVANVGNAATGPGSGLLEVVSGPVEVTRAASAFATVVPDGTASNLTTYRVQTDLAAPCNSMVTLRHTWTGAGQTVAEDLTYRIGGVPSVGSFATTASADVPKLIPDNNPTGVTSTLTMPASTDEVGAVKVHLSATHTFDSDVTATLVSPAGTTVTLVANRGGGGDNFNDTVFDDAAATAISAGTAPFAGSFRPEEPLSVLAGEAVAGTWSLVVKDSASLDTGALTAWSVELAPLVYPPCTPVTTFAALDDAPSVAENAGPLSFPVTLNNPAGGTYSVTLQTVNGTALAGADYTATTTTLTWAPGDPATKFFTVPLVDDAVVEATETLSVVTTAGDVPVTRDATGSVTNDDVAPPAPPKATVGNVRVKEGNTGTTRMVFKVTLSKVAAAPVTVRWATRNGSAKAPKDYRAGSGTATIAAGKRSVTIVVKVKGDRLKEKNETLRLVGSTITNAVWADRTGIGTIRNDD